MLSAHPHDAYATDRLARLHAAAGRRRQRRAKGESRPLERLAAVFARPWAARGRAVPPAVVATVRRP